MQKDSLTKQEKRDKRNIIKFLQRIGEYLRKLKKDLYKIKRKRHNIIEDIEYKGINEIKNLFNEISEVDYY